MEKKTKIFKEYHYDENHSHEVIDHTFLSEKKKKKVIGGRSGDSLKEYN